MHYDMSIKDSLIYLAMLDKNKKLQTLLPNEEATINIEQFGEWFQEYAKEVAEWIKKNGEFAQKNMRIE